MPKPKPTTKVRGGAPVSATTSSAVCSPTGQRHFAKDATCFSKEALHHIAEKAGAQSTAEKEAMWADLDRRMQGRACKAGDEACWVDKLKLTSDPVVAEDLRPLRPEEWKKDPNTWLTNYDIEAVMKQYPTARDDYVFLGVFPADFNAEKGAQCLYSDVCNLKMAEHLRRGVRYMGMIINLDKHNEPGSHWTSLFVILKGENAGAYYYDSVGSPPPASMKAFMRKLREEGQTWGAFKLQFNNRPHQKQNTECGMFAMLYQIRWLSLLDEAPETPFLKVVKVAWDDHWVGDFRAKLFRDKKAGGGGGGASSSASASNKGASNKSAFQVARKKRATQSKGRP